MDNDTKQIMTDGEKLRLMLQHEGWGVAERMLIEKIKELQNIASVDKSSPQAMYDSVKANDKASEILYSFLMEDIRGTVEQHINNSNLSKPTKSYIIREKE